MNRSISCPRSIVVRRGVVAGITRWNRSSNDDVRQQTPGWKRLCVEDSCEAPTQSVSDCCGTGSVEQLRGPAERQAEEERSELQ